MRIVYASSEAVPFAKTGGLADVAGALPAWLGRLKQRVILVIPRYGSIDPEAHGLAYQGSFGVPFAGGVERAELYRGTIGGDPAVQVCCIGNREYFDRSGLYQEGGADYPDNAERFGFFNRAVLEMCGFLSFSPDLIHCNDWQTGLIPAYLKTLYADHPLFRATATLFTIHNIAYQGLYDPERVFRATMLPRGIFNVEGVEFWGAFGFLKAGAYYADALNTVSETHRKEIQTGEYGFGLHGLLRTRSKDLYGIMNGLDYSVWDPAHDPFIPDTYTPASLEKKAASKALAMRELGITGGADTPLVVIISRLAAQKGLDLVAGIRHELGHRDLRLAILGTGEAYIQQALEEMANEFPGRVGVLLGYDDRMAHLLYAAADMFLMPSRYEPCGMGQLIGLRYGAIPIVRETGGLADAVLDYDAAGPGRGNGFVFREYSTTALLERIDRALALYHDKNSWRELTLTAMKADFGWESIAKKYLALYREYKKRVNPRKQRQG